MLNDKEIEFLKSKEHFLLKNEVDEHVNTLLHQVQNHILEIWSPDKNWCIPIEASRIPRKINKGNNHKGYPFQVTDFPSIFDKESIFTFRLVVWYGNIISFNLIITNTFINFFKPQLPKVCDGKTYLYRGTDVWQTDTSKGQHLLLKKSTIIEAEEYFKNNQSIRLFREFNMNQIDDITRLTKECFTDWLAK